MNIFLIRSGNDTKKAKDIIEKIKSNIENELVNKEQEKDKKKEKKARRTKEEIKKNINIDAYVKFSMLEYDEKRWDPTWRFKIDPILKETQLVLFLVGKESYKSHKIGYELWRAKKLKKNILFYKLEKNNKINNVLNKVDSFTQKKEIIADEIDSLNSLTPIIIEYYERKHIHLINENKEVYAPEYVKTLLEQYKYFADTSESLVNRRQQVNSFYITANTALITVATTTFSFNTSWLTRFFVTIILAIPGVLLNASWWKILEAYGINNSSKFNILGMMEKQLVASVYGAEWEDMSNKYNKRQYVSFTDSEKKLPKIFFVFYICLIILCIVGVVLLFLENKEVGFAIEIMEFLRDSK